MKISLSVTLKLGEDQFNVAMNLPAGTPSPKDPFCFSIKSGKETLMDVAIGDASHCLVGVHPPESMLSGSGVVTGLGLDVSAGTFDKDTGSFTDATAKTAADTGADKTAEQQDTGATS